MCNELPALTAHCTRTDQPAAGSAIRGPDIPDDVVSVTLAGTEVAPELRIANVIPCATGEAAESCSGGYSTSSRKRSGTTATLPPGPSVGEVRRTTDDGPTDATPGRTPSIAATISPRRVAVGVAPATSTSTGGASSTESRIT